MDQHDLATRFRGLHERDGAFIIPNPWDVGTARILASIGFEALATTSAGMAFALGLKDGDVSKDQALDHCRAVVGATDLPIFPIGGIDSQTLPQLVRAGATRAAVSSAICGAADPRAAARALRAMITGAEQ